MNFKSMRKLCLFTIFLLLYSVLNSANFEKDSIKIELGKIITKAHQLRSSSFNSSIVFLKNQYNLFLRSGDSLKAIPILL